VPHPFDLFLSDGWESTNPKKPIEQAETYRLETTAGQPLESFSAW